MRCFSMRREVFGFLFGVCVSGILIFRYMRGVEVEVVTSDVVEEDTSSLRLDVDMTNLPLGTNLEDAMKERAINNSIILVVCDSGYLDMAMNLYKTSFEKLKLNNYLFVGIDDQVCGKLTQLGVYCVTHEGSFGGKATGSNWGTKDFKLKTHFKTRVVLGGLQLGIKVLISDVDLIIFKDPFKFFNCEECDIEVTNDVIEGNSGFYLARPTKPAIDLHKKALEIAAKSGASISNQKALDRPMEEMIKKKTIKVNSLGRHEFPNGVNYFEEGHRYFVEDVACEKCVIVHNNWILTEDAKTYRFKEMGLWMVDRENYYSSESRKYLSFEFPAYNPTDPEKMRSLERDAMYSALMISRALNRTMILPKFHSYVKCTSKCDSNVGRPLNSHYKVSLFNDKVGVNNYREHTFLQSPLVPDAVKSSVIGPYAINTTLYMHLFPKTALPKESIYSPADVRKGPTLQELKSWFGKHSESVLHFYSLYGVYEFGKASHIDSNFNSLVSQAFKKDKYRQI